MESQESRQVVMERGIGESSVSVVESVLEKRLEDIVTILSSESYGKSRLYEEILTMFERILIRIALRRSNNVKSTAAMFLGINRNTLHNKIEKLGIKLEK